MDLSRVQLLVAQFLFENGYKEALDAYERESDVKFNDRACKKTSELIAILDEYHALTRERVHSKKLEFEDGDGDFCNKLLLDIPDLVGGINILAIRMSSSGDLFAGSTQGLLSVLPLKTPLPTDTNHLPIPSDMKVHSAGLIALDIFETDVGYLLLTGSMDRKCCLLKMTKDKDGPKIIQTFEHHKKFVVKVRWSYSGKYFVTASYDQSVCIYRETIPEQFELEKQMKFKGQVEGITFRKKTDVLIVSVRNDNYIHIIDLTLDEPQEVNTINMNIIGDDYVSFTVMDICCSPDDSLILVSTDQNRLIIYNFTGDEQIANFYGSLNDEFSQPRSCWHPSGQYIYSTSQDKCIVVWEVASQSVVTKLQGHTRIVRDLWYCEPLSVLVSCGFDGAVRLWHYDENS